MDVDQAARSASRSSVMVRMLGPKTIVFRSSARYAHQSGRSPVFGIAAPAEGAPRIHHALVEPAEAGVARPRVEAAHRASSAHRANEQRPRLVAIGIVALGHVLFGIMHRPVIAAVGAGLAAAFYIPSYVAGDAALAVSAAAMLVVVGIGAAWIRKSGVL